MRFQDYTEEEMRVLAEALEARGEELFTLATDEDYRDFREEAEQDIKILKQLIAATEIEP